jgi:type VI secretion system protein ImpI
MLMLEVVSPQRTSMGRNARRVIGEAEEGEFTIGRQDTCSWVFPQDYVSRQQAVIRIVNGMYFLERKGNAPLAINDRSRPVERNRIVRLSPGDRILIDDIEILVSETESADVESPEPRISAFPEVAGAIGPAIGETDNPGNILDLLGGKSASVADRDRGLEQRRDEQLFPKNAPAMEAVVDFQEASPAPSQTPPPLGDRWWEDTGSALPAIPDPGRGQRQSAAPLERFAPPTERAPPPEDAAPLERVASTERATPPVRVTPPPDPSRPPYRASASVSLDDVLRGAGLDPAQVAMSPEVARQLGEVLRIVVGGTMEVLKGRNDIRRELRVASTVIAARENNPLKFSADVDDALHKLFIQQAAAYLGTAAAFREAFSDIRRHQVALVKSVGAAFDHMLEKFAPKSLASKLGVAAGRAGVLGRAVKDKHWEAYLKYYEELIEDHEATYRKLFGEEWARAYEQELALQKRLSKSGEVGE